MNETLQEYVDSRGQPIQVDRQRGVIRGVKILGVHSRNGRTYLAEAIGQAAPLYENAKVNVNHAKTVSSGPRDYQDRIGVIRNVTVRADEGLFGDCYFNPKHALAEQLLWDAEHAPQNVGFSHNVLARTARRGDTIVVEAIIKVQSVDLVADPATTQGLFEAAKPDQPSGEPTPPSDDALLETLTAERLRESRPDLIEQILADAQNRLTQLQEEIERLRTAETARNRRETVLQLLAEAQTTGNPSADAWKQHAFNEAFIEALISAHDETAIRRLIRERIELVRDILGSERAARPTSREQTHIHQQPHDVRAFVRSIS